MLYDMGGVCAGNWGDDPVPDGYFLRDYDAPTRMTALQFLDKIGPLRFAHVWTAALANSEVAFQMVRGLAAQEVVIEESFPALHTLELLGLLPAGTAVEIWS